VFLDDVLDGVQALAGAVPQQVVVGGEVNVGFNHEAVGL